MGMFIGAYSHKVDSKKRITVPSEFMEQFGFDKNIIVSRVNVFNSDILAVFPNTEIFDENIGSYLSMDYDKNDDFCQRYVSSFSWSVKIDSANRIALKNMILVPEDGMMMFVGRRDLFEIWHHNDYEEYLKNNQYRLKK